VKTIACIFMSCSVLAMLSDAAWARIDEIDFDLCRYKERLRADLVFRTHVSGDEEAAVKPFRTSIKTVFEKELLVGIRPFDGYGILGDFRLVIGGTLRKHWDSDDGFLLQARAFYPLSALDLHRLVDRFCLEMGYTWDSDFGRPIPSHGRTGLWFGVWHKSSEGMFFGSPYEIDAGIRYYADAPAPMGIAKHGDSGRVQAGDPFFEVIVRAQWYAWPWLIPYGVVTGAAGDGLKEKRYSAHVGVRFPLSAFGIVDQAKRGSMTFFDRIEPFVEGRYVAPACKDVECISTETGIVGIRIRF
jgi:hypothetical protein